MLGSIPYLISIEWSLLFIKKYRSIAPKHPKRTISFTNKIADNILVNNNLTKAFPPSCLRASLITSAASSWDCRTKEGWDVKYLVTLEVYPTASYSPMPKIDKSQVSSSYCSLAKSCVFPLPRVKLSKKTAQKWPIAIWWSHNGPMAFPKPSFMSLKVQPPPQRWNHLLASPPGLWLDDVVIFMSNSMFTS